MYNGRNLETDRINYESQVKAKQVAEDKRQEELRKADSHKPYVECNFCHNQQYELFSKDPITALCQKCGKAFMADWK